MQGNLEVSRRYCKECNKETKFERASEVWGLGDVIMICCTLGLWLILRVINTNPWRCSTCGSKAGWLV